MFGARWIPDIDVDRARLRTTLAYRFTDTFSAGIEYNPLDDDVGPIANWVAVTETESWPALILGTSSDRIGTESGRSVYATLSKDLEHWTNLPVAPYAGIAYGQSDDEFHEIAGLVIRWSEKWTSYHMWDGYNFHQLLEWHVGGGHSVGVMLVQQDDDYFLGVTYNVGFSMPWED